MTSMSLRSNQNIAALAQAKAQTESARGHLGTQVATLRSNEDSLNKTVSIAPFNGIVTNLPVREGETMIVGIQYFGRLNLDDPRRYVGHHRRGQSR